MASGHVDFLADPVSYSDCLDQSKSIPPCTPRAPGVMVCLAGWSSPPALRWPILKGVSFWLVRFFAAGKRRSHPLVANYQRCLAPVRVVFGVGSACLFDQNGLALESVHIFKKAVFHQFGCSWWASVALATSQSCFAPARALVRGVQPPAKKSFSPQR